jgi:DNA replication and repair protein RecF
MAKQIILNNYRNYKHARLDLNSSSGAEKDIFVVYGENGQGKTNILEAISMFNGGYGLRKARPTDIIRKSSDEKLWSVIFQIDNDSFLCGYMNGRKVYKISDKLIYNLKSFLRSNYVLWMTYATDRLFVEAPANRRDFIDMFCASKFPDHETNLRAYEKLTKERMQILKKCEGVPKNQTFEKWLDVVEDRIVMIGLNIMKTRNRIVANIETCQESDDFPRFSNRVVIKCNADIGSPSSYKNELKLCRQKDFQVHSTSVGPNRSDWEVFHIGNQIEACFCSAGEQKMLILGVFLGFIRQNIKTDKRSLILILDDVIAHLDSAHRAILFSHLKSLRSFFRENGMQIMIWLSGIEEALFSDFYGEAIFFEIINDGEIIRHEY